MSTDELFLAAQAGTDYRDRISHVCEVAAEHAEQHDADATFPVEALAALRETGLLGLPLRRESGGMGASLGEVVDATLEFGRVDMSTAMIFGMHCQQAMVVDHYASPGLRAEMLAELAAGRIYLGSVTTEPGSGGRLMASDSLTREAKGMVAIDRIAPIVTGGRHADAYLVTVRSSGSKRASDVDLYYASRHQLDVEVTGPWDPLGMRATESVPIRLAGQVPASARLGQPGRFREIAVGQLAPVGHVVWAAAWLGTALGALSRVLVHIRSSEARTSFDAGSDRLLSQLGRLRCTVEGIHALLRYVVDVLESAPDPSAGQVQMALNALKVEAAERSFGVVHELVELVGLRHGYLRTSPLQLDRAFRDLRSASLNYANERLRQSTGALSLMDSRVRLA